MTTNQKVISMKVAPKTSRSIRAAAECGRVATRGARRGARRSEAILHASTPRLCALDARTERLLGAKTH